jgi:hypothetical protein
MDNIIESLNELGVFIDDGFVITSIEYVAHPLNMIWERRAKPPPSDASHWKSVLDVIHGERDTCRYQPSFLIPCVPHFVDHGRRCNTIHGFNLWNQKQASH